MKTILFVFLAATMSVFSFAADIALKDGRVLKDATIKTQTPRTVTIRHSLGLSSVSKELLPLELLAQYPIDEAAARVAEEKAVVAREAALIARKAEAERVALVLEQREKAAAEYEASHAKDTAREKAGLATVGANARSLAQRYFEKEYGGSSSGSRTVAVTINEVQPVAGVEGRWFVTGQAVIKIYRPAATGYSTYRQGGDSADEWRRQYDENQKAYEYQNRHDAREGSRRHDSEDRHHAQHTSENKTHTPPDVNHSSGGKHSSDVQTPVLFPPTQYEQSEYSSETREFQAYYSTEGSAPTIDITLR